MIHDCRLADVHSLTDVYSKRTPRQERRYRVVGGQMVEIIVCEW